MIENYLTYGIEHAMSNPKQWTVVSRLWKSPNNANVIRSTKNGYYPLRMSTVDKTTGKVIATEHSYRNAEVTHKDGKFFITQTCNPEGKVECLQMELKTLPEVRAYFREMLPKYASEQYKPIR